MITIEGITAAYRQRHDQYLVPLAQKLEQHIKDSIDGMPRIDRVAGRPKSVKSFVEKAMALEDGKPRYTDPLNQIQDQLGVRVIVFYVADVALVAESIEKYYAPIESQRVVPDSPNEFGYEGKHYIMFIPDDLLPAQPNEFRPQFFELQIKTLFQHAWGQANHDLAYKAPSRLTADQRRRVAFTAAQAWGADRVFSELAEELIGT